MTKREMLETIENLENEVKRLNFIIKNGGENKTSIKRNLGRYYFYANLEISYINAKSDEVKTLYMTCCSAHPTFTIYHDTKIEAIIRIDDMGVEWYKLDKESDILIRIPEPAGYTTYVRDELTEDDKIEPSDKTLEDLLFVTKSVETTTDPVHTCANCKHLKVINDNDIYAVCKRTHFVFEPFKIDTRKTKCHRGEFKDDPYSENEVANDDGPKESN